jgi:hypothetical protein
MKRYRVEVRELVEEINRLEGGRVEKISKVELRRDLGFQVEAELPSEARKEAKSQFAESSSGQSMGVRSCSSGPKQIVNLAVSKTRLVGIPPKGWVFKKPPATPEE